MVHTFRVTDRLEYLASAYFGDYKKDVIIRRDNGLSDTYKNSGELVESNLLVINPKKVVKQEITSNNNEASQHLGIIDQLKRTTSLKLSSLNMGNNFYSNITGASKKSNTKKKNGSKRKGQTGKNGNGGKNSNNWNHRDKYLKIAKNSLLINAINQLYRPGAYTGDGGTADILIHEFLTGQPLKHLQKARDMIDYLNRIISTQKLYNAVKRVTGK